MLDMPRILIIDDEPQVREILCEILSPEYECCKASSAEEGLQVLRDNEVALVISDINMKGITGLEMVPQILALAQDTVVIMMSGAQTIETAIGAMRVGAFDYLKKPFELRHLQAVVRRAFDHYKLRIAKRQYETQLETKVQQRTAALHHTTQQLEQQIAERNRAEERLNYLAYHDLLTELPNRTLFKDRLGQALKITRRENQIIAVFLLSIDQLKSINEMVGPALADELVCQVAERLRNCMREDDTLAYWGGDEFAFVFNQLVNSEASLEICHRLQSALKTKFTLKAHEVYINSSIGIALYPLNGADEESLMKNVGAALSHAKEGGGNKYEFYSAGMNAKALTRLSLESSLRRAIDREEFIIHYQPKVDINTWQISGAEALVRWQNPERGLVSPAEFIPLAEETGLIASIDEWVLRTSCVQMKQWLKVTSRSLTLACNISARQFQLPNFFDFIMSLLDDIQLDPKHLELELTESSVMTNPESGIRTLKALKNSGVGISIDDFGTGFSSLGYLKRLPIDTLKIDRSFVNDATTDPDDAALVMAIITLAHNLRLKVVAEGVETEEQLKFLHLLRCDEIQGYLFSQPVPADLFEELLDQELCPSNNWDALRRKLDIKVQRRQLRAA